MRSLRAWLLRLAGLVGTARRDRELADELETHLAFHIDDNIRAGMTPAEARRQAILALGGVAQTLERYRDRWGIPAVEASVRDVRYAVRMLRKHPGFAATAIVTMALGIGANSAIFTVIHAVLLKPLPYRQMIERLRSLPEVGAVAGVSHFPFSALTANVVFDVVGRPPAAPGEHLSAEFRSATPGYFATMGIPLVDGRDFDASDRADAPFVAIVNRAAAARYFPGQNALGASIRILGPKPRQIVGVVHDIRHRDLDRAPEPEIYVPHAQYPLGGMFLAVRARTGDPAQLAGTVRAEIRALDRDLPIASVRTFRSLVSETLSRRRFSLVLLTAFAVTALALSIVGIYGVLSFTVAQRAREIGIRMALGATRREVLSLTLRQGMRPVVAGLLIGVVTALATSRVLSDMLYEILPTDPTTLASVTGLLFAASLVATLVPARRAANVDPMVTLRHE